jgi:hypothetical protein
MSNPILKLANFPHAKVNLSPQEEELLNYILSELDQEYLFDKDAEYEIGFCDVRWFPFRLKDGSIVGLEEVVKSFSTRDEKIFSEITYDPVGEKLCVVWEEKYIPFFSGFGPIGNFW